MAQDTAAIRDIVRLPLDNRLRVAVEEHSEQPILHCYQCGKCSAGCPVAYAMDIPPHQVMRAIQLGLEEVLQSSAIWLCVFCQTCTARCPCEIDIARVMESLRMLAMERGNKPAEKDMHLFHQEFLNLIKSYGRVPELRLGLGFNLKSRHFLANAGLLPYMLLKKRLSIVHSLLSPTKVKGLDEVKRLFEKKTGSREVR